jgi:hypothetical protein
MDSNYWKGPIDCPACGASRETALAIATTTLDGISLLAGCCGLIVWQGSIISRGRAIAPATVVRRALATRPDLRPDDAFREPWEREIVLGLERSPLNSGSERDRQIGGHR